MTRFCAPLCAVLALGLLASGCGGGDDNGGGGGGGAAKTSEKKAPANNGGGGTAAKSAAVMMKNIQFNPKTVSVPKGGTVKWTNDDSVGHDVTGSDFKSGAAGGLSQGDAFSHTFNQAGSFKYRCTVHPGMEGTVTVK